MNQMNKTLMEVQKKNNNTDLDHDIDKIDT